MLTLITGGCRSGKSSHAVAIASASPETCKFFIATAEALDDEMRARIAHHRRIRPVEFETIEEPKNLTAGVESLYGRADVVIIDCLTLWISNLLGDHDDDAILAEADKLSPTLADAPF